MGTRPPVIFLHIGAMKTGTSFLQQLLAKNKQNLANGGYLFPGESWKEQSRATRGLLGIGTQDEKLRRQCDGVWDKLASQMANYEGKASIFSMEFLSFADERGAAGAVKSLTSRGAEVHVILAVRDAMQTLPAQWQSNSRSGGLVSWPEFAGSARLANEKGSREPAGSGARVFQRAQGAPRMLKAWGSAVQPGHLHVITVPPSGSDQMLLWERFAEVVGLDPALCSTHVRTSNTSLGQASAELMRRINGRLGHVPTTEYRPTVKRHLAGQILVKRSKLEARARLDVETLEFAADWNRRAREAIRSSGAHLVGDLDDLPVDIPAEVTAAAAGSLDDPSDDEILEAAIAAWDGMHKLVKRRVRALRKLEGRDVVLDPAATASWKPATSDSWSGASEPVSAAVEQLTDLVRVAIEMQRRLEAAEDAKQPA